jgi:hypothetical protein
VTLRWPLVGSLLALLAGAGLAALVLALCGRGGNESATADRTPTRTAVSRTVTVTRTPKAGTPATTGTPGRASPTPGQAAKTATPSSGGPAEETPAPPPPPPPPEETPTPGPAPTLGPGQTPLAPSPTRRPATTTPAARTSTPQATATPTPTALLPDLVLLDIFVSDDRIGVIVGNEGEGGLPAGQEVSFLVRGVLTETETLAAPLLPGTSVRVVLEDQVIYRPELVLAVVDPSNLIAEEDNNNNGMAKQLSPDVALDLGVHGVFRALDTNRLLVVIENPTAAPAVQVTVVVTVYTGTATEPTTASTYQLSIEAMGFDTVQVPGVAAVPGMQMRVVVEMTDPEDADPSNNIWEGTIS